MSLAVWVSCFVCFQVTSRRSKVVTRKMVCPKDPMCGHWALRKVVQIPRIFVFCDVFFETSSKHRLRRDTFWGVLRCFKRFVVAFSEVFGFRWSDIGSIFTLQQLNFACFEMCLLYFCLPRKKKNHATIHWKRSTQLSTKTSDPKDVADPHVPRKLLDEHLLTEKSVGRPRRNTEMAPKNTDKKT